MVYKCKICGGQTNVDTQNGIAICEYCGTKQALPLFSEESERLLYESGNNYLMHSEYDKAENVFNQLLTIKPNAAELYWDLVLCKYGVTYVEDPQTGKYIPTCNRTHYTPIFYDENYKKAIELSSGEKKTLFEEDAKTIDNIQKGIIAVSKKEKPFDIFISYKESDGNGNRTKDSVEAQKLYEKLTKEGYKVFFSRITLEDKIGTEYEPYIYAALYSSKVMITVCSSKENIEAVWVKNEWSRFLGFRQQDSSKTVLPLYFDMAKEELPDEFMLLSSYDMTVDGFEEELLRGIKKLIPLPIMKAKRRKKIMKITGITVAALIVVIGIASAIIVPKKLEEKRLLEEAQKQIEMERIYGNAYENALTLFNEGDYVGAANAFNAISEYKDSKQMAEKAMDELAYISAITLFENKNYTGAEEAFKKLGDFKDSAHMVERCHVQPQYDEAMQYYYDGKYAQSAWAFEALGDYEDAKEQKAKAELSWRRSLATVMSEDGYNSFVTSFYITPNGAVANADNLKEMTNDGKHGKVVSIGNFSYSLGIIYEDGTIGAQGSDEGEISSATDKEELGQNNIQIVPSHWEMGDIILKSDGTVHISNINGTEYTEIAEEYKKATTWKNIVMLSANAESYGNADFKEAVAGVDVDGNVFLCANFDWYDETPYKSFMSRTDLFKNVKTINIEIGGGYVNAVALTYDSKMVTYINGETTEKDAGDIVDACLKDGTVYTLSKDGNLKKEGSNQVIASDVVKLSDNHTFFDFSAITRSGAIYNANGCKTVVYDEWLSRMG